MLAYREGRNVAILCPADGCGLSFMDYCQFKVHVNTQHSTSTNLSQTEEAGSNLILPTLFHKKRAARRYQPYNRASLVVSKASVTPLQPNGKLFL